jgi:hypothetical protein
MNLDCLNDIITDRLAIQIDLTNNKSWVNFNTNLTAFSLTKWSGAVSDNINLIDFGLTEFDNGRTNIMWSGITLTPSDTLFSMYRVGYNDVSNPTTGQTSGVIATTQFLPITGITSTTGNYFNLNGGYLQGFFKLNDYNYELLPSRYNYGVTIETVLNLYPNSYGIFFMMGARAEDKYNPYFSGETITGLTNTTGVTTSLDNYLDALVGKEVTKKSFIYPEDNKETVYSETLQVNNIKNNVISFELTADKRLAYKYINDKGLIITNSSPTIITATGFTMIDVVFTPDTTFTTPIQLECAPQRTGKLVFYVNGRSVWIVNDFPEFYFHGFDNQKEKQIGVPYSISWGGGSFGLKNSWHYDYQTYVMYNGQDTNYINSNFIVQEDPTIGNNLLSELVLSADSNTFDYTVMNVEYTGGTGNTYYIKFNHPISILSNRDYTVDLWIYDDGFFKNTDSSGNTVNNKISILPYSDTVDISVVDDTEYMYPIINENELILQGLGLHPYPDGQEFEYIYSDGIMYYGVSGLPVIDQFGNLSNYGYASSIKLSGSTNQKSIVTGQGGWKNLKSTFRTPDNTGQKFVSIGLLIETSDVPNIDKSLFVKDFTYTAEDILVQDSRKNNLTIEQNFDSGFVGGIQKLRIYDNGLTSTEVLHNALIESKKNPNIVVSKGGRIINR